MDYLKARRSEVKILGWHKLRWVPWHNTIIFLIVI
jgi:hypothetical protein